MVIPKDSVLYNKHCNDELFNNIKVHGGLTYTDYVETDDEYLIGFELIDTMVECEHKRKYGAKEWVIKLTNT